ncbi:MAG: hypothetical protein IPP72_09995 [Chitinophagaceae bacterium]|nr:hypothetical protein [Chitinophagaceae bacterium]
MDDLIGKVLKVKKGYAPKFSAGNIEIPKITKVAELFNVKGSAEAVKLFNTFKTGRTIYRIAAVAGTAISVYGTIKAVDKAARKQDYQKALVGGLSTIGAGLLAKFLTKAAAYKAVDVFNGVAVKKIKDILSIQPASSTLGVGLYVNL